MSFKIVVDSCCELPEDFKARVACEIVPLTLMVEDEAIIDDETFDQKEFLRKVAASPNCPKSSCPSPERYMQAYDSGAERVYAVTLSSELSGSYNSAELGKKLFLEKYPDRNVHVFNSRSASCGEAQIAMKAAEYEEAGLSFAQVVEKVEAYITGMNTYFVLESLDSLRKNGRLTGVKALMATTLNIKPVMGATPEGTIVQLGQARGIARAMEKMVSIISKEVKDSVRKRLMITHCNNRARAEEVKKQLLSLNEYAEVVVLDTAGVSSLYASDGGIIVTV